MTTMLKRIRTLARSACAGERCIAKWPRRCARPWRPRALDDLLEHLDAGFSETLLRLIDRSGKKDSEVYKKANVDRKLFSKIRNNPNYKPSKPTALAFAIALELDLEETKDLLARAGLCPQLQQQIRRHC